MADRVIALGPQYYDNNEYEIKRIQWKIEPNAGGWADHFGLVAMSKATGEHIAYFDNSSFGDAPFWDTRQTGGVTTTYPSTFYGSNVVIHETIDLVQ